MVPSTAHRKASNFLTGEELDRDELLALLERAEGVTAAREATPWWASRWR